MGKMGKKIIECHVPSVSDRICVPLLSASISYERVGTLKALEHLNVAVQRADVSNILSRHEHVLL